MFEIIKAYKLEIRNQAAKNKFSLNSACLIMFINLCLKIWFLSFPKT